MLTSTAATAVRTLLSVLGCVTAAIVIYTIATDGLPFRIELLTRWMAATLIDFYINIAVISAWVVYKESSWIMATLWIVLLVCLGSITTCGYIVMQFFKLSPEEASTDPFYFVLVSQQKRASTEKRGSSVVTARVIFSALGCLMLGTLVYTIFVDGSPFRSDVFTPWMVATLVDFYVNVVVLSVWVAYKESSWISALLWILLLVCFGSATTCAYLVRELFYLSPRDPLSYVLFRSTHRKLQSSDPPLMNGTE